MKFDRRTLLQSAVAGLACLTLGSMTAKANAANPRSFVNKLHLDGDGLHVQYTFPKDGELLVSTAFIKNEHGCVITTYKRAVKGRAYLRNVTLVDGFLNCRYEPF